MVQWHCLRFDTMEANLVLPETGLSWACRATRILREKETGRLSMVSRCSRQAAQTWRFLCITRHSYRFHLGGYQQSEDPKILAGLDSIWFHHWLPLWPTLLHVVDCEGQEGSGFRPKEPQNSAHTRRPLGILVSLFEGEAAALWWAFASGFQPAGYGLALVCARMWSSGTPCRTQGCRGSKYLEIAPDADDCDPTGLSAFWVCARSSGSRQCEAHRPFSIESSRSSDFSTWQCCLCSHPQEPDHWSWWHRPT